MSYVDNNLSPNEKVMARGKIHWFVFVPGIIFLLLGSSFSPDADLAAVGGFFVVLAIIYFIKAAIFKSTTELAVTSKRVIAKFGFISRKTIELNLTKVESFNVDQSILGRIFGYGTLTINGTGGIRTPIPSIVRPLEFRRVANEQIEQAQR